MIGAAGVMTGPEGAAGTTGAWLGMTTGPDGAGGTAGESGAAAAGAAGVVVASLQAASVNMKNNAAKSDAWRKGWDCDRDVICLVGKSKLTLETGIKA